jgi:hypothetical protein
LEQENTYSEQKNTAFNSPLPVLNGFKKFFFGKENPEMLQKIAIYINLIIWFIFLIWHILSYSAISFREVIYEVKKVNVEILILNRGSELGYDPSVFMNRLLMFHKLSIVCWSIIFVGISLMWRLKKSYLYFILIPILFYISLLFFYMGFDYFKKDTTFFDKIIFAVFIINSLLYFFMLKAIEDKTGFFQEEIEE